MAVACLSPLKPLDPRLDLDALRASLNEASIADLLNNPVPLASWAAEHGAALIARIRELEAALATATQTERARCLAICRNHQCSWSKHAENLRADENVDQAIRAENRARTAAQCAEEIERGWAVPTQETP